MQRDSLDWVTVFGLKTFGADSLDRWSPELFYYYTGIAISQWREQGKTSNQ